MKALFWFFYILITLLSAAVLEFNRNTLAGWVLFVLLACAFPYVFHRFLKNRKLKAAGWFGYIALFALILFITRPPVKRVPAVSYSNPRTTDIIHTDKGDVSGVYTQDGTVEIYAGIPYAKPPVGELRWRPPVEADAWEGVKACDTFAPMSMQVTNSPFYDSLARIVGFHDYHISLKDNWREAVSEDSLYLNVWKPAGAQSKLPVLVYIHGGSLQTGQPWYSDYSGEQFARDGVITVNMGYRLGVFGFFADETLLKEDGTTGNYGLLDQIMALQWVKRNIEAFGGDPDNITLAGESAGAVCVDALCVSPLAKGLFRRAILESSTLASAEPPHSFRLFDEAIASGRSLMERYGASSVDDLRKLDAAEIVGEMSTQHHVTVDGYVLPDTPYNLRRRGIHNEEAILHGYNAEESGPFLLFNHAKLDDYEERIRSFYKDKADDILALYPAATDEEADKNWAAIYGAEFFNYSHYCLNRLAQANDIPSYEYYFSKSNGRLSSWHSGEMIYAFGMIPADSKLFDESDRDLSRIMHGCWTAFVKTGVPASSDLPEFPENSGSDKLMEFGDNIGLIDEPYLRLYAIMDEIHGFQADPVSE